MPIRIRQNPVIFSARPHICTCIGTQHFYGFNAHVMSYKNKMAGRKIWTFYDFGTLTNTARKTHFCTFSMTWGTFCTHQNHCYLYVLFSSQPQSIKFVRNLTRPLHFVGFTSEVGEASLSTLLWAIAATHCRKRTQM